jgi:hypothetical protein
MAVWRLLQSTICGAMTGHCASEAGISFRQYPWSEKRYAWSDVRRIVVTCYRRGRSGNNSFTLIMNNDARVDLYTSPNFFAELPSLKAALRDVQYAYDDTGIRDSCDSGLRRIKMP